MLVCGACLRCVQTRGFLLPLFLWRTHVAEGREYAQVVDDLETTCYQEGQAQRGGGQRRPCESRCERRGGVPRNGKNAGGGGALGGVYDRHGVGLARRDVEL